LPHCATQTDVRRSFCRGQIITLERVSGFRYTVNHSCFWPNHHT